MSDSESVHVNPVALPARSILPPPTVSAEARAYLSMGAANPVMERPDASDTAGWAEARVRSDEMFAPIVQAMLQNSAADVEEEVIDRVTVHVARPSRGTSSQAVYLYIHGGAFVFGGGLFARAQGALNA